MTCFGVNILWDDLTISNCEKEMFISEKCDIFNKCLVIYFYFCIYMQSAIKGKNVCDIKQLYFFSA